MRHFSSQMNSVITYSVNSGEYQSNEVDDYKKVVFLLADAMQVKETTVHAFIKRHFAAISLDWYRGDALYGAELAVMGSGDLFGLTPAEIDVLIRLCQFRCRVVYAMTCEDYTTSIQSAFVYSDLNTGESICWTLVVN